jgi:hypothetical protein
MEAFDEKLATRFLLGDLPEPSRVQLEERIFKDDRFYEQLVAFQEELADDYVQNKLSAKERSQFEEIFLKSPRRRQRTEFAAAFSLALTEPESFPVVTTSRRSGWWEALLQSLNPRAISLTTAVASAVALALLIAGAWLFVENRRLTSRVGQLRADNNSLIQQSGSNEAEAERKRQELESEIAALRSQGSEKEAIIQKKQRELEALRRAGSYRSSASSSGLAAVFILTPGLTRGTDEPEKLVIPVAAQSIQLQLDLDRDENYQSYVVEIRTARGNLVWSKSGLELQRTSYGRAAFLTIPAKLVSNGEYEATLKGATNGKVEPISYYYFIAFKKQ